MVKRGLGMLGGVALLASAAWAQNDKTRANSYDDAWEQGWVDHCRTVLQVGSGKTAGFVLQVGDSITHSNPYGTWIKSGAANMSTEDATIVAWFNGAAVGADQKTPTSKNGLYLALADTEANADGLRGMCAASGLRTDEFVNGNNNGSVVMPSETITANARAIVSSSTDPMPVYGGNLHVTTVAAAFADAQFAVLMLGTNDCSAGRSLSSFTADLTTIVNTFEGQYIAVVLSTIPPHYANTALGQSYNGAIRSFAQSRGLPLIDYEAEILARKPGTTWNGTLMGLNDVHPSFSSGSYTSGTNPYIDGGSSATHTTGAPAAEVGYLLRGWLTVQKLKEVKNYVVDGNNPPSSTPVPPPPAPPAASGGGEGENDDQCGCGTVAPAMPLGSAGLAALAALALLALRRIR